MIGTTPRDLVQGSCGGVKKKDDGAFCLLAGIIIHRFLVGVLFFFPTRSSRRVVIQISEMESLAAYVVLKALWIGFIQIFSMVARQGGSTIML